jgi:hypothetical protein
MMMKGDGWRKIDNKDGDANALYHDFFPKIEIEGPRE